MAIANNKNNNKLAPPIGSLAYNNSSDDDGNNGNNKLAPPIGSLACNDSGIEDRSLLGSQLSYLYFDSDLIFCDFVDDYDLNL